MFLASYVGVKSYRIFLYHKLFSPLRHIPGPKVSRDQRCRCYLSLWERFANNVCMFVVRAITSSLGNS